MIESFLSGLSIMTEIILFAIGAAAPLFMIFVVMLVCFSIYEKLA